MEEPERLKKPERWWCDSSLYALQTRSVRVDGPSTCVTGRAQEHVDDYPVHSAQEAVKTSTLPVSNASCQHVLLRRCYTEKATEAWHRHERWSWRRCGVVLAPGLALAARSGLWVRSAVAPPSPFTPPTCPSGGVMPRPSRPPPHSRSLLPRSDTC